MVRPAVKVGSTARNLSLTLVALAGVTLFLIWVWSDLGTEHLLPGLALACAPVPIYLALVLWIDRFEPEPPSLLAGAFAWGACIAGVVSYALNTAGADVLANDLGDRGTGHAMMVILSAPLVEETCKGLGLYLLAYFRRKDFDGVVDGVVFATMIALGFAMIENVSYYGYSLRFHRVADTFFLRGLVSPFAHPLFTCMTGIGLGVALETGKGRWRAPLGLLMAMALHCAWNFSATIHKELWQATYAVLMIPCALTVSVVVANALERERGWLRLYLAREMSSGAELAEICSIRGRYRSSLRYLLRRDFRRFRLNEQFLRTASQLAFLRRRQHQREIPPDFEEEDALRTRLFTLRSKMASQFARPEGTT